MGHFRGLNLRPEPAASLCSCEDLSDTEEDGFHFLFPADLPQRDSRDAPETVMWVCLCAEQSGHRRPCFRSQICHGSASGEEELMDTNCLTVGLWSETENHLIRIRK